MTSPLQSKTAISCVTCACSTSARRVLRHTSRRCWRHDFSSRWGWAADVLRAWHRQCIESTLGCLPLVCCRRHRRRRWFYCCCCTSSFSSMGSPSRGGDVTVYVYVPDINQLSLPTPFYSVLVSVSVFMVLSTVFHSIISPDNSPLSHSVLLVLFFLCGWRGLKHQLTN